jgi:uncharacterized protein with PQ loop repeat
MDIPPRIFYSTMGAIAGIISLAIYFPAIAAFIVFLSLGILILFIVCKGYRNSAIAVNYKYKVVVYRRQDSPIVFWFWIIFFSSWAIVSCVTAVLFLLHKFSGQR